MWQSVLKKEEREGERKERKERKKGKKKSRIWGKQCPQILKVMVH